MFQDLYESTKCVNEGGPLSCPSAGCTCGPEYRNPMNGKCIKCEGDTLSEAKFTHSDKMDSPSFSFPPCVSCRHNAPCRNGKCYACAQVNQYDKFVDNAMANYDEWLRDPEFFERSLDSYLTYEKPARFRYFVAGDIPDQNFLTMAKRVAAKHPDTKFLVFSKRHDLNLAIGHGTNLAVWRSMWEGWGEPDENYPQAWHIPKDGSETRAPKDAFACPCLPANKELGIPEDPGCARPLPARPATPAVYDKKGRVLVPAIPAREAMPHGCTHCFDNARPGQHVLFYDHGQEQDVEALASSEEVDKKTGKVKGKNWKKLVAKYGADSLKPTPITPYGKTEPYK